MSGLEPLPTIIYVDEKTDELNNFFNDAMDSGLFEAVHTLQPTGPLEEMIKVILDIPAEALITDFNLSEAHGNPYDGEKLVEALLQKREKFPCFIRTSFEAHALQATDDVNLVYSKNAKTEANNGRDLFERISLQIEKHRKKMQEWQVELNSLLEIPIESRNLQQIERLIELDTMIESSIGMDSQIPPAAKEIMLKGRSELIEQTQKLIDEIKHELGE